MKQLTQTMTRKVLAAMLQCSVRTVINKEKTLGLSAAKLPGRGWARYHPDKVRKILGLILICVQYNTNNPVKTSEGLDLSGG